MKIIVLGGDKRYISLMNNLEKSVDCIGFEEIDLNENVTKIGLDDLDISRYDIIILPILGINQNLEINTLNKNLTIDKDFFKCCKKGCIFYTGIINDTMKELLSGRKIVSFLEDKKVNNENDILTIEGVVEEVKKRKIKEITILGFGNLGSKLAAVFTEYKVTIGTNHEELIHAFADKFFLTTNPEQMKIHFQKSDFIINTVPKNIIEESLLQEKNPYILDIASYPYGVAKDISKNYSNYKLFSSIPSKYAPDKAGKILSKKIKKDLGGNL